MKKILLRTVVISAYTFSIIIHIFVYRSFIEKTRTLYLRLWEPYLNSANFSIFNFLWVNIQAFSFVIILAVLWSAAAIFVKKYYLSIYN